MIRRFAAALMVLAIALPLLTGCVMTASAENGEDVMDVEPIPTAVAIAVPDQPDPSATPVEEPTPTPPPALERPRPLKQWAYDPNMPKNSVEYDPTKPVIALTFDDGPSKNATPRILDVLEACSARATFFVVGLNVVKYPATIIREHELGCEIGNHTYSHRSLSTISIDEMHEEVESVNEMLVELIGEPARLLRPPRGNRDDIVRENVRYPYILWNIDTLDWSTRNAETTINTVLNYAKDGDIILMHDLYDATADAAEMLIPELIRRGFQLVTVSELFAIKNIELEPGRDYRKAN